MASIKGLALCGALLMAQAIPDRIADLTAMPGLFAAHASGGRWRRAPHLQLLDRALFDVAAGRLKRLIVTMPPRHGKSQLISRYFPAWYLGAFPDRRIILASYAQTFASKWGRAARNVLDQHGADLFGVTVDRNVSAAVNWTIAGHEGGMITAGVGGAITGQGADLLLIDDPVKNAEEANSSVYRESTWDWWQSTAYTRLEPGGACVLVQTRWHVDDLAGRLIRDMGDGGEPWRVLNLPAIAEAGDELGRAPGAALWPERYGVEQLATIRQAIGTENWLSLYQQKPVLEGGDKIKSSWFRYWGQHGDFIRLFDQERSNFKTVAGSQFTKFIICDAAGSSDDVRASVRGKQSWSCSQCWLLSGSGRATTLVLLDQIRGKWEFPELMRRNREFINHHKPSWFGAEDEKTGRALNQSLKDQGYTIKPQKHGGKDKLTRASSLLVLLENGQVYLPAAADWLRDFESEYVNWTGHPDDQADQIDPAAYAAINATSASSGAWGGVVDLRTGSGVLSW